MQNGCWRGGVFRALSCRMLATCRFKFLAPEHAGRLEIKNLNFNKYGKDAINNFQIDIVKWQLTFFK